MRLINKVSLTSLRFARTWVRRQVVRDWRATVRGWQAAIPGWRTVVHGWLTVVRSRQGRIILLLAGTYLTLRIAALVILPRPFFSRPRSAILLDRRGELLAARIASDEQWRFPPPRKIPENYREALLTFEDRRFYYHPGFDPAALVRALHLNLKHGQIVSGGSTITMQVIRLKREGRSRTISEKLIETWLAVLLELQYSKEEILTLYAGQAPFGGNIVGLNTAAWRYFGVGPDRLSWAEASLLAVLPNSPALFHPGRNRDRLREKRDTLLTTLRQRGRIAELEYRLALAEPLPPRPTPLPHLADHMLDTLRERDRKAEGRSARFESTIDSLLQRRSLAVFRSQTDRLRMRGVNNAALLVVDNRSGEIVVWIGNTEKNDTDSLRRRGNDIDITVRPRSTGSILKPFLYAAMLQEGEILPTTLVPDVPIRFQEFIPLNYDRRYRGAVQARQALARSLNIPSVHMLRQYGHRRFYHFLKALGMRTLHRSPDEYGLTLVLGGAEGRLRDLTAMYSALAVRAGQKSLSSLKSLRGEAGRELPADVLDPGAAYLTLQALLEVTRPEMENHWREFAFAQKIAWKTGTSNGLRDAWAIGVTPRYTVGVWAGNADGEGVAGLSGLSMAAPLMFAVFQTLEKSKWFSPPREDLKEVTVCRDDGYLPVASCPTVTIPAPAVSGFARISPYRKLVHLDLQEKYRVHGDCESTGRMVHRGWFVLPPAQEFYYRKVNPAYRALPELRPDCTEQNTRSLSLIYPTPGTRVYIPIGLDGKPGEVIFQAVHRHPETTIYWHLDEQYLGRTDSFHNFAARPAPGRHRLLLVDERGERLERNFEVLGRERGNGEDKVARIQ